MDRPAAQHLFGDQQWCIGTGLLAFCNGRPG
jgi:hypothetical protein